MLCFRSLPIDILIHKRASPRARDDDLLEHCFLMPSVGARAGTDKRAQNSSHSSAVLREPLRNMRAYGNLTPHKIDTEGIRTPAGRAQWISSPSP